MKLVHLRSRPLATLLAAAGLAVLYAGALRIGFLNDDYLFLEDARRHGFAGLLGTSGALANYFRPLSRAVWFGLLTPVADGRPLVFHAANFALFLLALVLLLDLLRTFAPLPGAAAGTLWFATLPLERVNLTWISCNQDLMALAAGLGALALFRRGRDRLALLAYLAAVLSKEAALPLPALLWLWSWRIEGAPPARTLRRVAPFALPVLVWALGEWHLRARAVAAARLQLGPTDIAAAYVHLAQSLFGLDAPVALREGLQTARPSLGALVLFAPLALALPQGAQVAPRPARLGGLFALAWLAAFGLPVAAVAFSWSAYFYTSAAVGGALLVALAAARIGRLGWLVLTMALLVWHAAAVSAPTFAVADDAWGRTSHLTPYYFERGARLSAKLRAALRRVAPAPARGTRFYFAALPSWAGFQMGNGAAIRELYRDDSLESFFYTRFDSSTAGTLPCVFLFWDGADFERMDALARDPFFQVGTDLLMVDRPVGAAWAFRRGLAAGEPAGELHYWRGWALRWAGDSPGAEAEWRAAGGPGDPARAARSLAAAQAALARADTAAARTALLDAALAEPLRAGTHAALGELLGASDAKLALLERRLTVRLAPDDTRARQSLVLGLASVHLDDAARTELDSLLAREPEWRSDTLTAELVRRLGAGGEPTREVVRPADVRVRRPWL